jgi:hypothetical protein
VSDAEFAEGQVWLWKDPLNVLPGSVFRVMKRSKTVKSFWWALDLIEGRVSPFPLEAMGRDGVRIA